MKAILALLALAAPMLAGDAKLFYSKSFPGSTPAYQEIRLTKDGKVEYREGPKEEDPIEFTISSSDAEAVYNLANKLGHFDHNLESGLKVARMGEKLFRWEDGSEVHEQKFNYTIDVDGQQLLDWFERMCESSQHYINLQRAVKYDKLGVNQALLLLETAWDKKRLLGVQQYLPLLDRVVKNESYLNMARERADKLATLFRNPPPPSASTAATPAQQ